MRSIGKKGPEDRGDSVKIFGKKEQKKRDVREKTSMDYTVYHFSKQEMVKYGILGLLGSALVLYLFYHSLFVCILLGAPGAVLFLRYMNRALVKKRQWQLMTEFKDAMDSFVAALVAGYSMANADKITDAAAEQLAAIRTIEAGPGLDSLPPVLEQTALLRIANPSCSLADLAQLAQPAVTKSCMNHRMRKLVELGRGGKE